MSLLDSAKHAARDYMSGQFSFPESGMGYSGILARNSGLFYVAGSGSGRVLWRDGAGLVWMCWPSGTAFRGTMDEREMIRQRMVLNALVEGLGKEYALRNGFAYVGNQRMFWTKPDRNTKKKWRSLRSLESTPIAGAFMEWQVAQAELAKARMDAATRAFMLPIAPTVVGDST